jgi:RNA polymerase II C-terminal domain phosphatase-like 3/4
MERYHFFGSSCWQFGFNCKSLAETKSDENETDGALAKILEGESLLIMISYPDKKLAILYLLLNLCGMELSVET